MIKEEIQLQEGKDEKYARLDQATRDDESGSGLWKLKDAVLDVGTGLMYITSMYQDAIALDKEGHDGAVVPKLEKDLKEFSNSLNSFLKARKLYSKNK